MGSDFQFSNAHQNYKNMDKLIKYVNKMVSFPYEIKTAFYFALLSVI